MIRYNANGVAHVNPEVPPGSMLVSLGSCSHTVAPYDVYARIFAKSAGITLTRAGVPHKIHICHRRSLGALGTGPNGAKRFGDDMMPPEIMVEVLVTDEDKVWDAMDNAARRRQSHRPFVIAGELWLDSGVWRRGDVWAKVVANALAIADSLKLAGDRAQRLRDYAAKKIPK